jgi:2-polyprenyl-3-methyl-5-hydroxy-6-metoxy-1,4-benzoquinol methylase
MNNLQRPCLFCGAESYLKYAATDENHRVSQEVFNYLKCSVCNGVFLDNPPHYLGSYYQNEYYDIPSLKGLQSVADKDRSKIETVCRFATGGRLLEVGPAFGVFAWQAKQAGFVVDTIEMDARCCEYLKQTLGVNVTQSNDPVAAMDSLPQHEVIAIWHVLEHLPDPLAFLRAATANLQAGGVLVIAMPNPDAWQFKIMGRHWPHLDAPRHLTLIPQPWLSEQAAALGLKRAYLTSDDSDARTWNRFGWQRLLMNRFKGKFMQHIMFVVGYGLSLVMAPVDRKKFNGSAYTIVFRKE